MYLERTSGRVHLPYNGSSLRFRPEDPSFGFRQMRFRTPLPEDLGEIRSPQVIPRALLVPRYYQDSTIFFRGKNDKYAIEDIEPQKNSLCQGINNDQITGEVMQFLLDRVYFDRREIVTEESVRAHSVDCSNLLIVRNRGDNAVRGFASGQIMDPLGSSGSKTIYLAGTMIDQTDNFEINLMGITNFKIIHNALFDFWRGIEDPPFPLPFIVMKTQNPIVLRAGLKAFPLNNLHSGEIQKDHNLMIALASSFGREVTEDWIVINDYPQRMWTSRVQESIENFNEETSRDRIHNLAHRICGRFLGEPTNSFLFLGMLDIPNFLESMRLHRFHEGNVNGFYSEVIDKAEKMKNWIETKKQ